MEVVILLDLSKDIKYIKGVGPNRATLLNKLGIFTLKDLIEYYPRDYEDRSKPKKIIELIDGEEALVKATVQTRLVEARIRKGLTLYKTKVADESGFLEITWYNQSYLKNQIKQGETYNFFGKVSFKYNKKEMNSPVFDLEDKSRNTGKIIPLYPLTYNLSQNVIRTIMENGMKEVNGNLKETLPDYILKENNLYDINVATKQIHFPDNFEKYNNARKRLAFEELLIMQLALLNLKKSYAADEKGIQFSKDVKMSELINELPFKLTKAQIRVLEEIDNDMESDKPMNRLLQGDVGSGKTIVSIIAAYKAVKCGYQVAIMAPTAILATQHLESFTQILGRFGINCELLISNITKKRKEELLERLQNGEIDVLIGTHALLEENVLFKNLGLVVTDEQHRFGV